VVVYEVNLYLEKAVIGRDRKAKRHNLKIVEIPEEQYSHELAQAKVQNWLNSPLNKIKRLETFGGFINVQKVSIKKEDGWETRTTNLFGDNKKLSIDLEGWHHGLIK